MDMNMTERISLYFSCISIFSLVIAMVAHSWRIIKFKKWQKGPSSLFLLVGYAADLVAYILLLITSHYCYLLGLAVSFFLASGCTINCFGMHMVLAIYNKKIETVYYFLVAGVVSFSIGCLTYIEGVTFHSGNEWCWYSSRRYAIEIFYGPRIGSFLVNVILFAIVTKKLCNSKLMWPDISKQLKRAEQRLYFKMITSLFISIGAVLSEKHVGDFILSTQGCITVIATSTKEIHSATKKICILENKEYPKLPSVNLSQDAIVMNTTLSSEEQI